MAAAATAMRKRIAHARERKRLRCDSSTTYRHDSLVEYVRGALPDDWSVVGPGAPVEGPEPPAAPSQYPPSAGEESQAALRAFLLAQGAGEAAVAALDLEDKINGHCETAAASFAGQVAAALRGGTAPEQALSTALATMIGALDAAGTPGQIALLFGPEARKMAMASPESGRAAGARAMWGPLPPAVDALLPGPDDDWLVSLTAGATVELPALLRRLAEHTPAADGLGADGVFALPLYVANYIWDGTELTPKQMREETHETACYSVHAVGLVFDQPRKAVLMADPNGPLLIGGGMEFLSVPHAKLPAGCKASTSVSQYDREQLPPPPPPPAKKKGGKKKRKRE